MVRIIKFLSVNNDRISGIKRSDNHNNFKSHSFYGIHYNGQGFCVFKY